MTTSTGSETAKLVSLAGYCSNSASSSSATTYNYDIWGNMVETQGSTTALVAQSNNRINGPMYDNLGNVVQDATGSTYLYDAESRLIQINAGSSSPLGGGVVNYVYDENGRRVVRNVAGTGTASAADGANYTAAVEYVYDISGQHIANFSPSSGALQLAEVFAGGRHLATYTADGNIYFAHSDWLGTERARTTYAGAPYEYCSSLPFGENATCAPASAGGTDVSPLHFTGKERDQESGLDYFGARYYGSNMGRFMSPDWSAQQEPVPYSKLDNPQSLNLYSYTLNNPLSNVDTDGHACSGILGNTGSGFCTRATEYGKIDGNATVRSQTRFFAAASAVSSSLADVDAPGSSLIGGISGKTASFLEGVGQNLQKLNQTEAAAIQNGSLIGPNLDQQLVHNEQSSVQGQLDSLKQSDPSAYNSTITQINGALNPGQNTLAGFAATRFPTDAAYAGVLDGVRKDLGRNIDFSNQGDREAIGDALVNHIRQTGGCDVTGSNGSGCH